MSPERKTELLREEIEQAFLLSPALISKYLTYAPDGKVESGTLNGLMAGTP